MSNNLLDLALLLQIAEGLPGQAAVDLQSIDEGGDGNEPVGLHILVELLGSGLVEDNGVVGLVLDCMVEEDCVSSIFFVLLPRLSSEGGGRNMSISDIQYSLPQTLTSLFFFFVGDFHSVPLPLDHFFFCFLPVVAAGAYTNRDHQPISYTYFLSHLLALTFVIDDWRHRRGTGSLTNHVGWNVRWLSTTRCSTAVEKKFESLSHGPKGAKLRVGYD